MPQKLLNFITTKVTITAKEIELCNRYFEPIVYSKNTLLEEEGKVPQYLYYIISGYLRLFHYNEAGDQVTSQINCPPGFFTSYNHFVNQTKAVENVESITDCELLRITKENLDLVMDESPAMKDFSIAVFQQSIEYHENRSRELATLTAEQRYKKLIEEQPDILQNVPIRYIASFLGIKPESLSRIRKNQIN